MVKRKCNVLPGVETRYNLVITMPDMLRGPVVTQSAVGLAANSPPVPQIAISSQAAAVLIISSLNFMPNYTVPYRHFLCSLQKCGKWKIRFYCHEDHQNYIHSIVSMSKFANGNNFPNSPFPSAPLPFP